MDQVKELVQDIKQLLDLRTFISSLGYNLDENDKLCCPFHFEKTPSCVVYPTHFKCFGGSCGKYGDYIDFYLGLNPTASFIEAINIGADFVGKEPLTEGSVSDEHIKELIVQAKQRKEIEKVYEEAANAYASFLASDKYHDELISFAEEKWGFDYEAVKEERIGYAPRQSGHLLKHLREAGFSDKDIEASGLFYKGDKGLYEVFRDRFIFPYIISGTPKYFIGRVPRNTDDDEILNNKGRPKYQKQMVHNSKNTHVSPIVQNRYLFNEDALYDRKQKEIIITEGVTDALICKRAGYPVVSPVTVRLRRQDLERYAKLFKTKTTVYIANDNEENESGIRGAMDSAEFLEQQGCFVKIIAIPKEDGIGKVDLNDYLKKAEDPTVAMATLKAKAITPLVFQIQNIDPDLDDMERTRQILELEDWWRRVRIADLPSYEKLMRDHFPMSAAAAKAVTTEIKQMKKESVAAKAKQVVDKSSWSVEEVVNDLFAAPNTARVCNDIGEVIFNYLQNSGAQFYCNRQDGHGVVYYKNKLYPYWSPKFRQLMFDIAKISKETSAGRAIFDYVNLKMLQVGHNIEMFSWIYSNRNQGKKYLNFSGDEESEIVCIDLANREPYSVPNGKNEDNVILANPHNCFSFKYIEEATIERTMELIEKYIFSGMTCSTANKYMVLSWLMCSFFVDDIGTRPHMRFEGDSGSGKTTAAKMITTLLYGKPQHQNGSTMAAIYDTSRTCPLICLDNIEDHNLSDSLVDFIVASATKATRQKKSGSNYSQVEEQAPNCMVMTNGIESLSKNELIQRSLIVEFSKANLKAGFSESLILHLISEQRDYILSGLLKVARHMYQTIRNSKRYQSLHYGLAENFPDNSKKRNIEALACMYIANRIFCKYIQHDYDYVIEAGMNEFEPRFVRFIGNHHVHKDIYRSWVTTQNYEDLEVNIGTNEVLFFLDIIKNRISRNMSHEMASEWLNMDILEVDGIFCIHFAASYLHQAFCTLAKEGARYTYKTPKQMMRRIRDSIEMLNNYGWVWRKNVKRDNKNRFHVLAKIDTPEQKKLLEDKWPEGFWG